MVVGVFVVVVINSVNNSISLKGFRRPVEKCLKLSESPYDSDIK